MSAHADRHRVTRTAGSHGMGAPVGPSTDPAGSDRLVIASCLICRRPLVVRLRGCYLPTLPQHLRIKAMLAAIDPELPVLRLKVSILTAGQLHPPGCWRQRHRQMARLARARRRRMDS